MLSVFGLMSYGMFAGSPKENKPEISKKNICETRYSAEKKIVKINNVLMTTWILRCNGQIVGALTCYCSHEYAVSVAAGLC